MQFSMSGRNFEIGTLGSLSEVLSNGNRKSVAIVRKNGELFRATDSMTGSFTQDKTEEGAARLFVEYVYCPEEIA